MVKPSEAFLPKGADVTTAGSEPAAPTAVPLSRGERRKARTRQMLIDAARVMLAGGTATEASIQEITDAADVGFGSFYNHFSTKSELFEAAVADVLEELGELFDRLSVDVGDAATAFAQSVRLTLRLCRSRPQISAVLVRHGMHTWSPRAGWRRACCAISGRAWHRADSLRPNRGWPEPPSPVRCWPRCRWR